MEYLEYDEEDGDNLFGSESEDNVKAGPSTLPTFNSAKPLNQGGIPLVGSLKGKERARAKDPQDRLDELRFMRMYKSPVHTGKGPRSLKEITQDGEFSCPTPPTCTRLMFQCSSITHLGSGMLERWSIDWWHSW
jgi:hypothetical protein